MKKLLMVSNRAQLVRRFGGFTLALLGCVLLSLSFWTAKAEQASAEPDFEGKKDPKKCTICHVPPGNPPNAHTITIGCSAVDPHMRNHPGDCLGPCPCQVTGTQNP